MNRGPLSLVGFAIGAVLLYLALYAGAMEVRLNVGSDSYATLLLGELWFGLAPGTLNFLQAIIQRYLSPELWDPGIVTVLLWPAWMVFAVPGAALVALSRQGRKAVFG